MVLRGYDDSFPEKEHSMLTLRSLERVAPALLPHRSATVLPIDWEFLQTALGVRLPTDFREFADHYPAVAIDDYLAIGVPEPGKENQYVSGLHNINDVIEGLIEDYPLHPAEDGLIPWGSSNQGDLFFWHTNDPDPDRWPAVVYSSNGDVWEHDGGMLSLLVGLIDGSIEHWGLAPDAPGPNPSIKLMVSAPDSQE
jgi:hypothetical protein